MNREIYLVLIAIVVSLQVSFAQTQADSLEPPKLIEIMSYVCHEGAKKDRCTDPDENPLDQYEVINNSGK